MCSMPDEDEGMQVQEYKIEAYGTVTPPPEEQEEDEES